MPARAGSQRVPENLGVHVRVRIDQAGRHDVPVRIDRFARAVTDFPDRSDLAAFNRDITLVSRHPTSIDDRAVTNDQVVHGSLLFGLALKLTVYPRHVAQRVIYGGLVREVTGNTAVPHHPRLGLVPRRAPMQQAAIVPHHRIPRRPVVMIDAWRTTG